MKKERHIYLEEELYQVLNNYSFNKRKSINESVNDLIKLGLEADSNMKLVTELKNTVNRINKNTYLTFELLKQLYADLNFPQVSDMKTSESLNIFFRKIKGNKYND